MSIRNRFVGLCSLFALILSFDSQSAVTVYCCDAAAEAQYIQDLNALPSIAIDTATESFEGDAWSGTRTTPALSVTSQSITWAPSSSEVAGVRTSTGGGDVHEGTYLMFAADATNGHLTPDKYTLTANGITLYGVGGWFRSTGGAKLAFTTNGAGVVDFTGEQATVFDWTFLGFIDDGGFSNLLIETADEVGNEANIFFSDDFTLGAQSGAFPGQKLQFSSAVYSADENASTAQITVQRSGGTSGSLSIDYATTSDGTATAGQDFSATSGTLSFADGESSKQFSVALLDDGVYEGDETVSLVLTGSAVGALNTATLTIRENDPQPVGSVGFSGSAYRVDESSASLTVTVQRNDGSVGSGSIDYATNDGTASAGNDYTAASGTLSFIDGQISSSFSVDISDDALQEGAEAILISLSNPVSVTLGDQSFAVITIQDNEPIPSAGSVQFSGSAFTVTEGASEILVPVTRISGSSGAVSVVCGTADSSALAGSDYTATQSTISFADGEMVQHCRIPILNDSSYENDEMLIVNLGTPSGGAVLGFPSMAVVTLKNDDPVPAAGSLQFSLLEYAQTESGGAASISVSRSGGASGAVSINYATSDSSATSGQDYSAASGTLNFADGVASAAFQITVLDDSTYEGDERVSLTLSNPSGGAVLGAATDANLTIDDDESAPASGIFAFSQSEYSADEFDGSVSVEVARQSGSQGVAMVNYTTGDGTATAGGDYEVAGGTLLFADGEVSKSFQVTLIDDALYEGAETINLTLSNAFGAILGTTTTSAINLGDDDAPGTAGAVDFSTAVYTIAEDGGSVTATVTRSGGSTGAISIDYATLDGSATASSDYTFSTGRISFADGDATAKTFSVPIIDDSELEGDEQLTLQLTNSQGGAVLGAQSTAQITVTDDEAQSAPATLSFTVNSLSVSESSASADITVSRGLVVSGSVTVDLTVESTTAVAGTDYNVTTGTLQFVDGESAKTVIVAIIDNAAVDGDRTLTFSLGNATGSAVIDSNNGSLILTIVDDEQSDSDNGGGGGGGVDPLTLFILLSSAILLSRRRLIFPVRRAAGKGPLQ
ncbi:MAG: hypothetical protein KZQ99_00735 [Candidatus Thiodiazotropha sp. (ex Dulcina madagascariensis)]|nr:hypothetical protein [Candidatus Thiodiazotropha sp. (ex Dulcina madagascariensis)]